MCGITGFIGGNKKANVIIVARYFQPEDLLVTVNDQIEVHFQINASYLINVHPTLL